MKYLATVQLTYRDKSYTYITHRANNFTATVLDFKFAFRTGEYRLLNPNAGLTAPSHFSKEVVSEQDMEETIRWLKKLGFVQEDGSAGSLQAGPAMKKHL